MPQEKTWENEYQDPQLLTKGSEPQKDVRRFLRFLRKDENINLENLNVLDLGSGTGRNANYLAELGNRVVGLEISETAVDLAESRAKELRVEVDYRVQDIGSKYPFDDQTFDLVLDVMSSNSLNEMERDINLSEVNRVLKRNGYFFVKALCKDGDKNAKALLKNSPGLEQDTYIIEDIGLVERVFSQTDFINLYSQYFEILKLQKKTNYTRFKGQRYKRNFWLAYLKKVK